MSFRDSSPDLSGAAAGFPGPADCHDGRSYGCIRDPTTADTASWHHFGQASDSSATASGLQNQSKVPLQLPAQS